jgi:hypothetical protein
LRKTRVDTEVVDILVGVNRKALAVRESMVVVDVVLEMTMTTNKKMKKNKTEPEGRERYRLVAKIIRFLLLLVSIQSKRGGIFTIADCKINICVEEESIVAMALCGLQVLLSFCIPPNANAHQGEAAMNAMGGWGLVVESIA